MPSNLTAIVLGHAGSDAELRYTPSGTQVASFSVAVDQGRKVDGEWQSDTVWVRVQAFGGRAEQAQRVTKGCVVQVVGRLRMEQWQTREGETRTTPTVMADSLVIMDRRERQESGAPPAAKAPARQPMTREEIDDLPF